MARKGTEGEEGGGGGGGGKRLPLWLACRLVMDAVDWKGPFDGGVKGVVGLDLSPVTLLEAFPARQHFWNFNVCSIFETCDS